MIIEFQQNGHLKEFIFNVNFTINIKANQLADLKILNKDTSKK